LKKRSFKKKNTFIILIWLFFSWSVIYPIDYSVKQLTQREKEEILKKGYSLRLKEVKGSPWPELILKTFINAKPEEACAVFFAYDEHKDFIPDLKISKPLRYHSPTELDLYFVLNIPWPLKDSHYITYNKLEKNGEGGYRIVWKMVKSDSAKDSYGGIEFIPYEGKTLLVYKNLSIPKHKIAKLFKGKMLKKAIKTVFAIVKRVELIKKEKPEKLRNYMERLRGALKGEYIYKEILKNE